jgi:uncharacterized repeat protein (TIGR01451 family)
LDSYGTSYEEVEILGYCGATPAIPSLNYMSNSPSYKISGTRARVYKQGSVAATNANGKLSVAFSACVDSIVIKYRLVASTSSITRFIDISPIYIHSVPPPPPVNEDGWSFTKRVNKYDASTCDQLIYTFNIRNTNCETKPAIGFTDVLPAGMKWVSCGLDTLSSALNGDSFQPQISSDGALLQIPQLLVPGATTLVLTAIAVFDEDAESGDYDNQASITYSRIIEGSDPEVQTLASVDAYTLDPFTTVSATAEDTPPVDISIADTYSQPTYKEGNVITVTYVVDNPNPYSITGASMNILFNPEFTYVPNSLAVPAISPAPVVMVYPTNPDLGILNIAGASDGSGFELPSGETTITFQLQAPVKANLVIDSDTNKPVDLEIDYSLSSDMSDICIQGAMPGDGSKLIPYSMGKAYIISNKQVTGKIKR